MKRTDPSGASWLARARTLPDDVSATLDEVRASAAATRDSVDTLVWILAGLTVLVAASYWLSLDTARRLAVR